MAGFVGLQQDNVEFLSCGWQSGAEESTFVLAVAVAAAVVTAKERLVRLCSRSWSTIE